MSGVRLAACDGRCAEHVGTERGLEAENLKTKGQPVRRRRRSDAPGHVRENVHVPPRSFDQPQLRAEPHQAFALDSLVGKVAGSGRLTEAATAVITSAERFRM
jgi:hypothetical protein